CVTRSPAAAAMAAYSLLIATGTVRSSAPCTSVTGTPRGSSAAGSATAYRSGTPASEPPISAAAAPAPRPYASQISSEQQPASETTPDGRTAECQGEPGGRRCRAAAQSARCPPAECPAHTIRSGQAPKDATSSPTASSAAATSSNVSGHPPPR